MAIDHLCDSLRRKGTLGSTFPSIPSINPSCPNLIPANVRSFVPFIVDMKGQEKKKEVKLKKVKRTYLPRIQSRDRHGKMNSAGLIVHPRCKQHT